MRWVERLDWGGRGGITATRLQQQQQQQPPSLNELLNKLGALFAHDAIIAELQTSASLVRRVMAPPRRRPSMLAASVCQHDDKSRSRSPAHSLDDIQRQLFNNAIHYRDNRTYTAGSFPLPVIYDYLLHPVWRVVTPYIDRHVGLTTGLRVRTARRIAV